MDNQNRFGSFGQTSPDDMSAIRAALERRGMGDVPQALNQQSAASATPAGAPTEPLPSPQSQGMAPATPPQSPGQVGVSETEIILKAMADRLKMDSKIKAAQAGLEGGK